MTHKICGKCGLEKALSTEQEEVLRLKIMCHKIDKERAKAQIELEQLKTQ